MREKQLLWSLLNDLADIENGRLDISVFDDKLRHPAELLVDKGFAEWVETTTSKTVRITDAGYNTIELSDPSNWED